MSIPKALEVALISAESAFARALIGSTDAGASWAETRHLIFKVRAHCRQLHAALARLNRSESATNIERARAHCRELRAVFLELNPSALIPFRCLERTCSLLGSPRTSCWLAFLEASIAAHRLPEQTSGIPIPIPNAEPDQAIARLHGSVSKQEPVARDSGPGISLLRQATDLLVLVLAYLLFFFIDVELRIASLPLPLTWMAVIE